MRTSTKVKAIKRQRTAKIARLLARSYYLNKLRNKDKLYAMLGDEMMEMGGVYVKFLQGVMLQSWMMKRWQSPKRLNIFENLDSQPLDIHRILADNLGDQATQIIDLQTKPFAAGSFGQVYFGQHIDGTPIIVKVLRPFIKETLKFDLKLLKRFWRVTHKRLNPSSSFNLDGAFEEFASQTLKETDYISEAEFANEQYLAYKHHPQLVIPRTYLELSTQQIIVQEYIGGISGAQLISQMTTGADPKQYIEQHLGSDLVNQLQTLAYELLWGTFNLPRIMGDAHPGNVKFLANNQIALIDFGISAQACSNQPAYLSMLREYNQLSKGNFNIANLFSSSMRLFGNELYRALGQVSKLVGREADLNVELSKMIKTNFEVLSGGEDLEVILKSPKAVVMFDRIVNRNNRFGFSMSIPDAEMMRAIMSFITLIDSLGVFREVMQPTYTKVIDKVNQVYPEVQTKPDPDMSIGRALDILHEWLERVANKDPVLFRNLMSKLNAGRKLLSQGKLDNAKEKVEDTATKKG